MPRASRVDANHGDVVKALRKAGCLVQSLASVGDGCPDLLVKTPRHRLMLLEVKDGSRKPSERKLKPDQEAWHAAWTPCSLYLVLSPADALRAAWEVDNEPQH